MTPSLIRRKIIAAHTQSIQTIAHLRDIRQAIESIPRHRDLLDWIIDKEDKAEALATAIQELATDIRTGW